MTLEEAFEKYSDETILKRKDALEILAADIKWLKGLKAWGKVWGNEESRKLGVIVPQLMIDDANANDWEVITQEKSI